jgi:DNA-binding protein
MTQLTVNQRHIVARFMDATSLEIEQGKEWYRQAFNVCNRIGLDYGLNAETVAAVIAALSPNNKWERNIKDAENVVAAYMLGGVDDALGVRVCTYGKNLSKAVDILNSCHNRYEELLKGPKIIEFYHCITGLYEDVCIDGHAYSVWFGERLTMKQVPSIGKKLREQIKSDYRTATQFVNDNGDEYFTTCQIQAITWCAHKRLHGV